MDNKGLQLSRFLGDLEQSRAFAEYIIHRKWRDRGPKSKLIHLAFNTSLIVSYCRPFTVHKNAEGLKVWPTQLTQHIIGVLTPNEIELHDALINCRHTTYAHSDASAHLIPGFPYGGPSIQLTKDPFYYLLTKSETTMLQGIIVKWIKHLRKEKSKLTGR